MRTLYRRLLLESRPRQWARWLRQGARHVSRPGRYPVLGSFFVTYRCNHFCDMCPTHETDREVRGPRGKEPGTDRMLALVDQMVDLGVLGIGFTGGEPLLRKDLDALVRRAAARGVLVHLNTNGFLLDDASLV